jgi:hypothetical protein
MIELGTVKGHAHKAGKSKKGSRSKNSAVVVSWFHPVAYAVAMTIADDDRQRVHVAPDGSGAVIVSNHPRRPVWLQP